MKIKGSSRIISAKAEQENLVSVAEAVDLLPKEHVIIEQEAELSAKEPVTIEQDQSKIGKAKRIAKDLLEQSKPFIEKQKLFATETIKKAKALHPYLDKSITAMDVGIDYITKPHHLVGRRQVVQDTRSPAVFGMWVMFITFGIGMVWAMTAPLDSASHALGKIVLDSKKRILNAPEPGVIKEVLVRDGDHVTKGQTLVILNDTQARALKQQAEYRYLNILAEVDRLTAERDDLQEIVFSDDLKEKENDPKVKSIMAHQEKLFKAAKETINSQIASKNSQITHAIAQKDAIIPQIEAVEQLIKINNDQVNSYKKLFANGNISKPHLQEAQSNLANNLGRKGQLVSSLAAQESAIINSQEDLNSFKNKIFEDVANKLKQAHSEMTSIHEELNRWTASLNHTIITAPEEGNISGVNQDLTPGSYILQQHPLMEIIPQDDKLLVDAKIDALDIAAIRVGQPTFVRLTAYRARVVPVLEGKLISIAADVSMPTQIEMSTMGPKPYYRARIEINKDSLDEVAKLKNVFLYPGMGVDVMIVTGTRTLMKYIMDPITLTLDHSFIEK